MRLKLMRNSFGVGGVLAAAQVGVGSGLGVLDWPLSFSAIRGWGQLLTWVAFIFAVSVAGGAVVGRRALRRPRPTLTIWARVAAAGAAGLGCAAAFPLVWIPVRVNQPTVDLTAEVTMAVTAGFGVLAGMVLAVIALSWKPVTAGVAASAAWVWLFALASVALAARDHVRVTPRLGMIDAPQALAFDGWWPGPYLMVGVAAPLGLAVAAVAGWKGAGWVGIALSGLAGPGLVASAYLITGWGVSGNGEDLGPYVASLLAVCSGVLASLAVASATIPHHPPAPPVTRVGALPRPALGSLPAPLAITAYAEPAYVLELSSVEPPYRRQPAFYTEPIYLPGPRPSSGPTPQVRSGRAATSDLTPRPEPAAEASYEPPYEEPYEPPYASRYDPKGAPQPAAVAQPAPESSGEVALSYEPGHAAAAVAVVLEPVAIAVAAAGPVRDAAVVDSTTSIAEPADVTPVDAQPVEAQPVDAQPVEAQPVPAVVDEPAAGQTKTGGRGKNANKGKERRPSGRRGRRLDSEGSRALRQGERDHIDWIDNLVKLPVDPTLKMSKER